jgi:hypothetical protein
MGVTALQIGALLKRAIPWRWALYWLLIPNLAIILMWPIGGPSMKPALLLFGLAGLLVSQLPWVRVKQAILLAMMGLIMAHYLCLMFNLPIWAIEHLPEFALEVQPWRVPFYLAGAALFVAAIALTLRQAPRVPRFSSLVPMLVGFAAIFGLGWLDDAATASTRESYHAVPGPNAPFRPATEATGLARPPATGHHVVVVLVEALGQPAGRVERQLFEADWNRPEWRGRYQVSHGRTPYYGSTTSAELRELCGAWGEYARFDFARAHCLPQRYKQAGYRTTAMHSFAGRLFDRAHWYPKLHFDRIEFGPDLERNGVSACGGMFPGACDRDVPALIAQRLKAATQPEMIYWLTLNSHLPVVEDSTLGTQDCAFGPSAWSAENPQVCRLFLAHHRVADALHAMLMDPALPPTDVLIVGDHMPPFFDRDSRLRFDGSHVPWILLRNKDGAVGGAENTASPQTLTQSGDKVSEARRG